MEVVMRGASTSRWVRSLVLLGGLVACDNSGLRPVGDGPSDTGGPVEQEDLLGILVSPERTVIPLGGEVQLRATGLRDDRTSLDVTALATWGTEHSWVAEVSDELDQEGVLQGLAEGETQVYAEVGGVRSVPVKVTVTASEVAALTATPAKVTVEVGRTARVAAEATWSDGSRADASGQVLWSTGDPSIATIEAGGLISAVAPGETVVSATWGELGTRQVPVVVLEGSTVDLTVDSARAEGGEDEITLTVKLRNDGTAGASDFWVDVFVDPPSPPEVGQWGDHFGPVFYLEAGEQKDVTFTFAAEPGEHTLWVFVDPDDAIEESDEANNALSTTVTVGDLGGTNLTIPYFDYYADSEHILYLVDVYNSGTEPVGPFWVDLWVHAEDDPSEGLGDVRGGLCLGDEFEQVDVLGPGETVYLDFLVEVASLSPELAGCAYCWSWAMVDTCDDISEIYEDDNTAGPLEVEVVAEE